MIYLRNNLGFSSAGRTLSGYSASDLPHADTRRTLGTSGVRGIQPGIHDPCLGYFASHMGMARSPHIGGTVRYPLLVAFLVLTASGSFIKPRCWGRWRSQRRTDKIARLCCLLLACERGRDDRTTIAYLVRDLVGNEYVYMVSSRAAWRCCLKHLPVQGGAEQERWWSRWERYNLFVVLANSVS